MRIETRHSIAVRLADILSTRVLCCCLFMAMSLVPWAQKRDFWGMQSAEVVYRISPRYTISAGEQVMWNQNATALKTVMGDIALGIRWSPGWSTEVHYRPIGAVDARQRWLGRNMFFATVTYSHQQGKWSWHVRERLQRLGYNEGLVDEYRDPKVYNRSRIGVKYQHNYYWSLLANTEGFLPLNGSRKYLWDQVRTSIGVGYRYNKHWRAECSYGLMQQLNRSVNRQLYFVMLATHYYF